MVDVMWPAPRRLPEEGAVTIGYDRDVVLPLVIVPQDRSKPVVLRLTLDYAICQKLCVPAQGEAELALAGDRASSMEAALAAAEARVPKKIALGEGGTLAIRSVRREDGGAQPRVIALLDLEVIEDQGQIPVGTHGRGHVEGDALLVGQGQDHVGAPAILQLEQLIDVIAPGAPPWLRPYRSSASTALPAKLPADSYRSAGPAPTSPTANPAPAAASWYRS